MQKEMMQEQKQHLIDVWKSHGIIWDEQLIAAFRAVPRENFVPREYKKYTYDDSALPLVKGQTISQPTTVMIMTQALEVKPGMKVLEIGAGSGYQSAVLSVMVGKQGMIYTVEIEKEVCAIARRNLKEYKNVKIVEGDGSLGFQEAAPFDRCIITAACPSIPQPVIDQLKEGGIVVAPVGSVYVQKMVKGVKKGNVLETESLGDFVFVKLQGKYGFK